MGAAFAISSFITPNEARSLVKADPLMMPTTVNEQVPVPPPAYHREKTRFGPARPFDALTLVNTLHLLTLCRLAVCLAHRRCPPPLPAGKGGAPRTYSEESLLLIALLTHAVATLLPGYARLVMRLACLSPGLWLAIWAPAFLAPRSNGSAGNGQERLCRRRSLSSAC